MCATICGRTVCVDICVCVLVAQIMSESLRPHGLWPTRLFYPWDPPGKDTGVSCLSLLQGIFMAQGLNLGLLHCSWILYHLSQQGSPIDIHAYICINLFTS